MIDYLSDPDNRSYVLQRLVEHVQLCGVSLGVAFLIAVPLGILLSRYARAATPTLGTLGAIYTIPSIALFGLLVPFLGIGTLPAVVALVIYAQFILVRNIVAGLNGVDPAIIEAARGMGMSPLQILARVELPLALPVIVAGLRIATVTVIAVATVATYIAAGGLGDVLADSIQKIQSLASAEIEAGALALALLAIVADLILRAVEYAAGRAAGRPSRASALSR